MMKKIFLLLSAIVVLISCSNTTNNSSQYDKLDEKIDYELNKGVKNDSIFLGFSFGMNEKEALSHCNKLVSENKIKTTQNNQFEYTLSLGSNSAFKSQTATLHTEFYDERLYKLSLHIESASPELLAFEIERLYSKKYSSSIMTKLELDNETINNFYWINGNQQINIGNSIGFVHISYIDLLAEIEKKKEEDKKKQALSDKTIEDI